MKKSIWLVIILFISFAVTSCKTDPASEDVIQLVTEQSVLDLIQGKPALEDRFGLALSHNNYFYHDGIDIEISTTVKGAKIRYTTDSSDPSPTHGTEYTEPVNVPAVYKEKAFILRIIAYTDDDESNILTHTYFVHPDIDERFTTLVFSITSDPSNFYDYEKGILIEGKLRDEWKAEHRRQEPIPPDPANYNLRGREGERPIHLEVFTESGLCVISQAAGVRVHGGWSRAANKKTLAFYPRDEYDPNFGTLAYDFFPGDTKEDEYGSTLNEYRSLMLRNGGNDREGSYMREELCQQLAQDADILFAKNCRPASVFVNGEYYGIAWLQEFHNEKYIADKIGSDNKDLIEIGEWNEPVPEDVLDDEKFAEYAELMDLDNFMLYYAFEIYSGNRDWPHNNKKFWRYTETDGEYISKYYDGKYRMLLYDVEMAWGMYSAGFKERTIQRIRNDRSSPAFTTLMKRDDMVEKFCNQMFDLINTVFRYDHVEQVYNKIVGAYDDEMQEAIKAKVISSWLRMKNIENERDSILNFAENRADFVIDDMVRSFNLENRRYYVRVLGNENATVKLNTLISENKDKNYLFSTYFTAHKVEISCIPDPGYKFDYWDINGQRHTNPTLVISSDYGVNVTATAIVSADESFDITVIDKIYTGKDNNYVILKNITGKDITIKDLYLSNDEKNLTLYHIPKIRFIPYSILTISANPKNLKYLLPFTLTAGDTLYLSDRDGTILARLKLPQMSTDEILARKPNGSYKVTKLES